MATATPGSSTYDCDGNLWTHTDFNGHTVTYGYDGANGLQSIVDATNPTGTPTPFWTYSYNLDGNRQVTGATDPIAGNGLHSYVRNALEQVTGDTQTGAPIRPASAGAMTAPTGRPAGATARRTPAAPTRWITQMS